MATKKNQGTPANDRLPIKVILPKQGTEKIITGGGGNKLFREVTSEHRTSLAKQIKAIEEAVRLSPKIPAPIRVKLYSKATAKSHRPERIFSSETCPIIGCGAIGELFVKASPNGLKKLTSIILNDVTQKGESELSAIDAIEPVTPNYRRKGITPLDILRNSPKRKGRFVARVKLFDLGTNDDSQADVVRDFEGNCKKLDIQISSQGYSAQSYTYEVRCKNVTDIEELSKIVSVRHVTPMPSIRMVRPKAINHKPIPKMPTRGEIDDIPVVVVVDSGISKDNPDLESWVVGRQADVAPIYENTSHGTFVAGLICWGAKLNPTVSGIDDNPCGVFDLQVIPNDDPEHGEILQLMESELLISLESALIQHSSKYKVWNLSLGTDSLCSLDEFSPLAERLDTLQEKYQVSFVISAGNFQQLPLLGYPRENNQISIGRITSPADSVLGITVGSISHVDYVNNGPKKYQLAPYSRHGAGPNHIIKPDLVHYGGSCSFDLTHTSGIRSISGLNSAEDIGTSFSTPLISRTLAQIYHQVVPTPSPVLARALLTHNAKHPSNGKRVPEGEENYLGFGLPSSMPYCLECSPNSATLIFEDVLRPGYFLEWDDFPYPSSLHRNGRFYGDISMTIAFAPSRGSRWGTEYCETHVEANFGVYYTKTGRKTGKQTEEFKGLVPPEFKNTGLMYESFQIESLRKWAPVRTYYGSLGESGERGNRWRLKLRLLSRHGVDKQRTFEPQKFSLIVTISDPENKHPVYDETARIIHNRFRSENLNLKFVQQINNQQRIQD